MSKDAFMETETGTGRSSGKLRCESDGQKALTFL